MPVKFRSAILSLPERGLQAIESRHSLDKYKHRESTSSEVLHLSDQQILSRLVQRLLLSKYFSRPTQKLFLSNCAKANLFYSLEATCYDVMLMRLILY